MSIIPLFRKFLVTFFSIIGKVLGFIPAFIYGATYRLIGQQAAKRKDIKKVLDIGTATGHPLHSIIKTFGNAEVVGIDIDKNYIPACQKLFKDYSNVTIRELNFYDVETQYPDNNFDVIIFGSSFMLMPDQVKAIEIAKKKLTKNGKIYFLLTLYKQRNGFTSFMEIAKPYLKYATTVDFGKLTYADQFHQFLNDHKLKISHSQRCTGNTFLKIFKFYIYETAVM